MRIELPFPSWAEAAHRAQDDAHTLTLPAQRQVLLTELWFAPAAASEPLSVSVPGGAPPALTLTF